jgi:hypothetical protein
MRGHIIELTPDGRWLNRQSDLFRSLSNCCINEAAISAIERSSWQRNLALMISDFVTSFYE